MEDFPSGQVLKTLCSQCRGLNSQSGKMPRGTAKKIYIYVNDIHFLPPP